MTQTRTARSVRTFVLALLGALAVLVFVSHDVAPAASKKAEFSVGASPSAQTVQQGGVATYTVTMLPVNGYANTVALQAGGLPNGATASFSPATVSPSSKVSTLTVQTSSSMQAKAYSFTVTGVNGKDQSSVDLTLAVTAPPPSPAFALAASPSSQQVAAGSTAVYAVGVSRTSGFTGSVALSVAGLPAGASASFSPNPATSTTSTLTVTTHDGATPDGNSSLTLTGTSPGQANRSVTVTLSVKSQDKRNFGISGDLPGALALGVTRSLDLRLANDNNQPIDVTNLTVTVDHTSAGPGCSPANFAVVPYSGPYPLTVGKNATRSLSGLGVPALFWPRVQMLNLPQSQDTCKGVVITLAYSGSAQGSS